MWLWLAAACLLLIDHKCFGQNGCSEKTVQMEGRKDENNTGFCLLIIYKATISFWGIWITA